MISISRSGKPPSYYLDDDDDDDDDDWSDKVEWIEHDIVVNNDGSNGIGNNVGGQNSMLMEKLQVVLSRETSNDVDVTIVGCIGDLNPSQTWLDLWGLGFDDERLLRDNGKVYEQFLNDTMTPLLSSPSLSPSPSSSSQKQKQQHVELRRLVLLSLDYVSQKCLEGPIEGYLDGKRLAERKFLETLSLERSESNNRDKDGQEDQQRRPEDDVVVIGLSSFVFGGKRFPNFGKLYRTIVESPFAKAYVKSNKALRSLSKTTPEDWVEEMVRSFVRMFVRSFVTLF